MIENLAGTDVVLSSVIDDILISATALSLTDVMNVNVAVVFSFRMISLISHMTECWLLFKISNFATS